jgi:hypothetical protein
MGVRSAAGTDVASVALAYNAWSTVAGTYNPEVAVGVFCNGVTAADSAVPAHTWLDRELWLGREYYLSGESGAFFGGLICELRLAEALEAEENKLISDAYLTPATLYGVSAEGSV